jgi:hypothetical protein
MEAEMLLIEDALASTSAQVRQEDVGMYHNVHELNGEAKKGFSSLHDSRSNNEAVELQKVTPLAHSPSKMRNKVVEPSWRNFWQSPVTLSHNCHAVAVCS